MIDHAKILAALAELRTTAEAAHRHGTGPCSACGCEGHIWPGSLRAAGYDLNRAVGDLWWEISAPFARLLDRITRRRS